MTGTTHLYFAYGSNLDPTQMLTRCGQVVSIGPARLPCHRLAFGGKSARWEGGVATVLAAPGSNVDGLLFELDAAGLEKLDRHEGYPRSYRRQLVDVIEYRGTAQRAWIYLKRPGKFRPNPPSEKYLGVLRREYQRNGFDPEPLECAAKDAAKDVPTRVFVYGTLLKGEPNHALLANAKSIGPAQTVAGYRLHDLGAYPAMVEGGEGTVDGELYEVDAGTLAAIDRLEGHPAYYQRVVVKLAGGGEAKTYVMQPTGVATRAVVETGNWKARASAGRGSC